jgi:hypothetical protein
VNHAVHIYVYGLVGSARWLLSFGLLGSRGRPAAPSRLWVITWQLRDFDQNLGCGDGVVGCSCLAGVTRVPIRTLAVATELSVASAWPESVGADDDRGCGDRVVGGSACRAWEWSLVAD